MVQYQLPGSLRKAQIDSNNCFVQTLGIPKFATIYRVIAATLPFRAPNEQSPQTIGAQPTWPGRNSAAERYAPGQPGEGRENGGFGIAIAMAWKV